MIGLSGIWHTSFTVSNLGRSLAFYSDLLGLEIVHRQTQDNAYTRQLVGYPDACLEVAMLRVPSAPSGPSGHHLELVEYVSPEGSVLQPKPADVTCAHFALVVGDLRAAHLLLSQSGVRFMSDPVAITEGRNRGGFSVYFYDPDGILLEMVEPPKGPLP